MTGGCNALPFVHQEKHMASRIRALTEQVRGYVLKRIFNHVTGKLMNDPTYGDKVARLAVFKYKSWELAMAEAAQAYELRETDNEEWRRKQAAALDARAEFIDTMREYCGIDLISVDPEHPSFPIRPATYAIMGAPNAGYLYKVTSDEIPELNYPTPLFTGHSLKDFKKQVSAIARKANEAEAAKAIQERYEERAEYYGNTVGRQTLKPSAT
jgi:hypothetical protein